MIKFGGLVLVVSFIVDWYRAPTAPTQFAQNVLYDIENQPKIITQLSHNKPMLLYFWGSWCHYCKMVSPSMQQLSEEGVEVLAVALRSGDETEVKSYLNSNGYRFSTLNDPNGAFSQTWGIRVTPTILVIKDGKIIHHTTGYTGYLSLKVRLWLADWFA